MTAAAGRSRRPAAAQAQAAIHLRNVSAERIHIVQQLPPAVGGELGNLRLLASRVDHFWIDGVLRAAIPHETPFHVPRTLVPGAVEHPWAALEGHAREASPQAEPGPLIETFDQSGRLLLVLGEPGSGKTISLLEIARDLNARFQADPTQPVAVVFNLAGWAAKRPPLAAWLLGELASKYFIPKKVARRWFASARLVLLLDGLDEMAEADRAACATAIREFLGSQAVSGIAVTCRTKEYAALSVKLPLAAGVQLQTLTDPQVTAFLDASGRPTQAVQLLLSENRELREVARTPLMLSVMLSVYGERRPDAPDPADAPAPAATGDWSAFLFDAYVERMIARKRAASSGYTPERLRYWLSWVAANLEARGQPALYLEHLQPGWIPSRWQRMLYVGASRIPLAVAFAVVLHLVIPLMILLDPDVLDKVPRPPIEEWALQTVMGIARLGLAVAIVDSLFLTRRSDPVRSPGLLKWGRAVCYVVAESVIGGRPAMATLLMTLRAGGLSAETDIRPVEVLRISLRNAWTGARQGVRVWFKTMAISLPVATIALLATDVQSLDPDIPGDLALLTIGPGFLLVIFFLSGALYRMTSTHLLESRSVPNQGIRLTARNSLMAGVLYGVGVATIQIVVFAIAHVVDLVAYPDDVVETKKAVVGTLRMAFLTGYFTAIMAMLWHSGFDVLKHYTLRLFLWVGGYTPRSYVKFLEAAADAGLLYRIGGGYRFLHHRLQAHLANRLPEYAQAAEARSLRWAARGRPVGA